MIDTLLPEIIIGVLIPSIGGIIFVIRYFWKKEKCFTLMQQKINEVSDQDKLDSTNYEILKNTMNGIENRTTALESKIDLVINHFDINNKSKHMAN